MIVGFMSVTPTRDRRGESVLSGYLQGYLLGLGWWMLQIHGPEPILCSIPLMWDPVRGT